MNYKIFKELGILLSTVDYTQPLEVVLENYFKPMSNPRHKGEFKIKGLENFVFPVETIVFSKEEGAEHLRHLILDNWTVPMTDSNTYEIFKNNNEDQTVKLKNILQDSTLNNHLLQFAINNGTISKQDLMEYFKLGPVLLPSVLNSIKVISLEEIIIIIPFFEDNNCSITHQYLMEFLLINTIIHSQYLELFYKDVSKFNCLWERYLKLFNYLDQNFFAVNDFKRFVNFSLYNYFREKDKLASLYPEINKCINFWILFYFYKIQSIYNRAMSTTVDNQDALLNINVSLPINHEVLRKIDEVYPVCDEKEKAFCNVILFMITLQQKDYLKAIKYGEILQADANLVDKIKSFNLRYKVLDLQGKCEILRIDNNHIKGKIAWGLLESYVQLQQFERGASLLFSKDIFPLPLLKIYAKRHTLTAEYKWDNVSKKLFRTLSTFNQDDLLTFFSNINSEKETSIIQERELEIPIPLLRALLFGAKNKLLEAKVPELEDLYPLIVLARVFFGSRKEDEWTENEAGVILEEDLRLLLEFQMQMEIALIDQDLLILAPERIGSHQNHYYSQNLYKDFSRRLIQMIKVLIVTEEFILAEFFIELFKKYFYSFEELLEFETFFTKLLSSKNQKLEISIVQKLQEAIQTTQSIEKIEQSAKNRLTNQLNYIQEIYTQVGQTAYYFSKSMKDEVIYDMLKNKLNDSDFETIGNKLQLQWEKEFKNYHISSHQEMKIREDLKRDFGSNLDKLEEKTVDFLISGIITYKELAPFPETSNIDFSGPIIPLSKAVEYELQKKIFIPYRDSFKNSNFDRIPKSLKSKNDKFFNKNEKKNDNLLKNHEMTLGSFKYMAGLNKKGVIDNYEREQFLGYCEKLFFNTGEGLEILIYDELLKLIEDLRIRYRNKAAHTAYLSKVSAEECVVLVTKTRKIMHLLATHYK